MKTTYKRLTEPTVQRIENNNAIVTQDIEITVEYSAGNKLTDKVTKIAILYCVGITERNINDFLKGSNIKTIKSLIPIIFEADFDECHGEIDIDNLVISQAVRNPETGKLKLYKGKVQFSRNVFTPNTDEYVEDRRDKDEDNIYLPDELRK